MAGDGDNILDLSMESECVTSKSNIAGTKETRTLRSQARKKTAKIDSDLEIVDELSEDSDGIKFDKTHKVPDLELNLNLKTSRVKMQVAKFYVRQRI